LSLIAQLDFWEPWVSNHNGWIYQNLCTLKMSPMFIKFTYIWPNNLRYVKCKNQKFSFKIFILPLFGLCHTTLTNWIVYWYCKTNNPNHLAFRWPCIVINSYNTNHVITKHLWPIHSCYLNHVFTCVRQENYLVALLSDPTAFKATWLVTMPEK